MGLIDNRGFGARCRRETEHGEALHLAVEIPIGQRARVARLAFPNQRRLVPPRAAGMTIDAVDARIQRAAHDLIAFILYLNVFFAPVQQLSQVFDTYQQARAAATKLAELLATPVSTPESPGALPPLKLGVLLRHLKGQLSALEDE